MKQYLGREGLEQLAHTVTGNERIYLGVRPCGFHAGNQLSIALYPALFCDLVRRVGIEPRFTFYLFLNDYEQDALEGADLTLYPFNVRPRCTTLQYTPGPLEGYGSIVDFWEPLIRRDVAKIQQKFPHTKLLTVRNSSLKSYDSFFGLLGASLTGSSTIGKIIANYTRKEVDHESAQYVIGVCPACRWARADVSYSTTNLTAETTVTLECSHCTRTHRRRAKDFDYWFYHKPLALPRLKIFDIDICFTGMDHFIEGDFEIRRELISVFDPSIRMPKMVFAPRILIEGEHKMSKKAGTASYVPWTILEAAAVSSNGTALSLSSRHIEWGIKVTSLPLNYSPLNLPSIENRYENCRC